MTRRCRDTANDDRGYMIVLDDTDINKLLDLKKAGNENAINEFLVNEYKKLVM